ncbi:MAG: hypothetical protein ACPG9S_00980, partial [Flavobacteriales bacterium]
MNPDSTTTQTSTLAPPRVLEAREREQATALFLVLAGVFVASLVSCNLIFRKFFAWDLGGFTFEQSVGLL